jgi:hypothetical protein
MRQCEGNATVRRHISYSAKRALTRSSSYVVVSGVRTADTCLSLPWPSQRSTNMDETLFTNTLPHARYVAYSGCEIPFLARPRPRRIRTWTSHKSPALRFFGLVPLSCVRCSTGAVSAAVLAAEPPPSWRLDMEDDVVMERAACRGLSPAKSENTGIRLRFLSKKRHV